MSKKTIIRFYPFFMLKQQDEWLRKMSNTGLHLVNYGLFRYIFEVGQPEDKHYFSYVHLDPNNGYYSFSMRYPMLSKSLGVPMWRSKLNFNNNKARVIIEVSPDIMNTEKVKEYYDLVKEREYLYSRYAIRTTIFFTVCGIMLFLAHIFGWFR